MEITIDVEDIPDDIYNLLQKRAKENRRSINDEILAILEKATRSYREEIQQSAGKKVMNPKGERNVKFTSKNKNREKAFIFNKKL